MGHKRQGCHSCHGDLFPLLHAVGVPGPRIRLGADFNWDHHWCRRGQHGRSSSWRLSHREANATGETRQTITPGSGEFNPPFLRSGEYPLSITASGFKTPTLSGITLRVDQTANLRVPLEVGAATETVEVTGMAPLVDSATSSPGQVIQNKQILAHAGGHQFAPQDGFAILTLICKNRLVVQRYSCFQL